MFPHDPIAPGRIDYPVFKPIGIAALQALALPPRGLLLAPWLAQSSLTLLHGPRGIGKTRLALAIAHAVAAGSSLLGWRAPTPRNVLFIDGEMPVHDLQAACALLPPLPDPARLRILAMDLEQDQLDLTRYGHRFRLEEHLAGADLVVVDNLATLATGGAENAADSWRPVEAWARAQRRAGRAVLLVHHSGRLGQQRGTTRREDRMDSILALRPAPDAADKPGQGRGARFALHLEKHRGSLPAGAFPLRAELLSDGWHASPLAADPAAAIAGLAAAGLSVRAIAARLGLPPSTVQRRRTAVPPVPPVPNPVRDETVHPMPAPAPGARTPRQAESPPPMLVDSHCHLDYFKPEELPDLIRRAREMGVGSMVTIGTTIAQSLRIRAIAEAWDNVWCTGGIHPHHAGEGEVPAPETLAALTEHPKVIGLGEAGLDYFYDRAPRARQQSVFRAHIRAARLAGLPLAIHARDADLDIINILQDEYDNGGDFNFLLHCFSSSRQLAEHAVKLGGYVSFSGILTFPKSEEFRAIARDLPAERLLVETDAPYLAPVPLRGKRNEPAYTAHTAAVLAKVRGLEIQQLSDLTTANFHRLFKKAAA